MAEKLRLGELQVGREYPVSGVWNSAQGTYVFLNGSPLGIRIGNFTAGRELEEDLAIRQMERPRSLLPDLEYALAR